MSDIIKLCHEVKHSEEKGVPKSSESSVPHSKLSYQPHDRARSKAKPSIGVIPALSGSPNASRPSTPSLSCAPPRRKTTPTVAGATHQGGGGGRRSRLGPGLGSDSIRVAEASASSHAFKRAELKQSGTTRSSSRTPSAAAGTKRKTKSSCRTPITATGVRSFTPNSIKTPTKEDPFRVPSSRAGSLPSMSSLPSNSYPHPIIHTPDRLSGSLSLPIRSATRLPRPSSGSLHGSTAVAEPVALTSSPDYKRLSKLYANAGSNPSSYARNSNRSLFSQDQHHRLGRTERQWTPPSGRLSAPSSGYLDGTMRASTQKYLSLSADKNNKKTKKKNGAAERFDYRPQDSVIRRVPEKESISPCTKATVEPAPDAGRSSPLATYGAPRHHHTLHTAPLLYQPAKSCPAHHLSKTMNTIPKNRNRCAGTPYPDSPLDGVVPELQPLGVTERSLDDPLADCASSSSADSSRPPSPLPSCPTETISDQSLLDLQEANESNGLQWSLPSSVETEKDAEEEEVADEPHDEDDPLLISGDGGLLSTGTTGNENLRQVGAIPSSLADGRRRGARGGCTVTPLDSAMLYTPPASLYKSLLPSPAPHPPQPQHDDESSEANETPASRPRGGSLLSSQSDATEMDSCPSLPDTPVQAGDNEPVEVVPSASDIDMPAVLQPQPLHSAPFTLPSPNSPDLTTNHFTRLPVCPHHDDGDMPPMEAKPSPSPSPASTTQRPLVPSASPPPAPSVTSPRRGRITGLSPYPVTHTYNGVLEPVSGILKKKAASASPSCPGGMTTTTTTPTAVRQRPRSASCGTQRATPRGFAQASISPTGKAKRPPSNTNAKSVGPNPTAAPEEEPSPRKVVQIEPTVALKDTVVSELKALWKAFEASHRIMERCPPSARGEAAITFHPIENYKTIIKSVSLCQLHRALGYCVRDEGKMAFLRFQLRAPWLAFPTELYASVFSGIRHHNLGVLYGVMDEGSSVARYFEASESLMCQRAVGGKQKAYGAQCGIPNHIAEEGKPSKETAESVTAPNELPTHPHPHNPISSLFFSAPVPAVAAGVGGAGLGGGYAARPPQNSLSFSPAWPASHTGFLLGTTLPPTPTVFLYLRREVQGISLAPRSGPHAGRLFDTQNPRCGEMEKTKTSSLLSFPSYETPSCQRRSWDLHELADLLWQALCGLRYLHRLCLAHGNIKPSNFIRAADGHLVMSDFGLPLFPDVMTEAMEHVSFAAPRGSSTPPGTAKKKKSGESSSDEMPPSGDAPHPSHDATTREWEFYPFLHVRDSLRRPWEVTPPNPSPTLNAHRSCPEGGETAMQGNLRASAATNEYLNEWNAASRPAAPSGDAVKQTSPVCRRESDVVENADPSSPSLTDYFCFLHHFMAPECLVVTEDEEENEPEKAVTLTTPLGLHRQDRRPPHGSGSAQLYVDYSRVTPASDMYAIGVLFYWLYKGQFPPLPPYPKARRVRPPPCDGVEGTPHASPTSSSPAPTYQVDPPQPFHIPWLMPGPTPAAAAVAAAAAAAGPYPQQANWFGATAGNRPSGTAPMPPITSAMTRMMQMQQRQHQTKGQEQPQQQSQLPAEVIEGDNNSLDFLLHWLLQPDPARRLNSQNARLLGFFCTYGAQRHELLAMKERSRQLWAARQKQVEQG